ncbi:MAG: HAD-IB family hydrolase [Acidimicrobiales bacterium]
MTRRSDGLSAAPTGGSAAVVDPGAGRLALFDLDRTIYPGSTLVPFARAMRSRGLVSGAQLLKGMGRNVVFRRSGSTDALVDRVRRELLAGAEGIERRLVEEVALEVADEVVDGARVGLRLLIDRHLAAGDFCVVLSASPQELVSAVARRLGVQRGVGTVAATADGLYTGEIDGAFCYGAGKLVRLADALGAVDLDTAAAYADSISDLPVLEAVGEAVVVRPDAELRRIAADRGWPIVDFDDRAAGRRSWISPAATS